MIPVRGEPVARVHESEQRNFEHLVGKKLTYQGYRDFDKQLKLLLKNVRAIAVEYSPKAAVPAVSRVDAGTMEVIRGAGVQVRSSDTLVQYTKAIWGDPGRTAHYVAVHHLVELLKEALAFVQKRLQSGTPVSEYEVQQVITHGMTVRGLVGLPPVVAAGVDTADPYYVPTAVKTAQIRRGDLDIVISLAAKLDKPEGIYAAQTWVAIADSTVPIASRARSRPRPSRAIRRCLYIAERAHKKRPLTGAEAHDATRLLIDKGRARRGRTAPHRSFDRQRLPGRRRRFLDDFEVKDSRILTPGTGFTVGPGLYVAGTFGVRTEVAASTSRRPGRRSRRRRKTSSSRCSSSGRERADPRRRTGDAVRRRREARAGRRRRDDPRAPGAAALAPRVAEILVASPHDIAELRTVRDTIDGVGPLAGIAAGLEAARTPWLLVVAGDMPELSGALIDLLLATTADAREAVALRIANQPEPLLCVLRVSRRRASRSTRCCARATTRPRACSPSGWRRRGSEEAAARALDPELRGLRNVNAPGDL